MPIDPSAPSEQALPRAGQERPWGVLGVTRSPSAKPPATDDADRSARAKESEQFFPAAPESLSEAGLSEGVVEALAVRFLLHCGTATGWEISDQVRLSFKLVEPLLRRLKEERIVVCRGAARLHDYVYELTESGCERAARYAARCTYFGAAPVTLDDYSKSVHAQASKNRALRAEDLGTAFRDLTLDQEILAQVGQAIHFGQGMFLYGAPGNGKTSIAARATRALGETIWVPYAIGVAGRIIRVYDPNDHETIPADDSAAGDASRLDKRWVRIRRPTIIVGGELTLDNLEIQTDASTGISEAPVHVKSNCGTLVIDDFGRQRVSPRELLNRWIVPLEKRFDFLNLPNGRKVQLPFEQLVVFSTNLKPSELVDEAFLRRIPYKIEVRDPTDAQFRTVFLSVAQVMGVACDSQSLDYLISRHYRAAGRPMRFCHPGDLLRQVRTYCAFHGRALAATQDAIDAAVRNYFATI